MAKFHHACDLSFSKNEHLHDHMTINKVLNYFAAFTLRLHLLPQQRPAAHRHVPTLLTTISQPGSATNLVDSRSHVTGPIDAPPFIEGCGRPNSPTTPPQRPRHNNNNATTLTTSATMTAPCYRPSPPVECHVSEKEGTRRREWGNMRQQDPYCCPRYAHCLRLTASPFAKAAPKHRAA
jgi:hypothetical protein